MQTNKIEKLLNRSQDSLKTQLLDFSSRYNNSEMIYYSDMNILTFETYDRNYNPANPSDVKKIPKDSILFYIITPGTQYKPWLVSQDAYGDPGYWWFIMEFNNFFDIEDFKAGITMKIPPIHLIARG